MVLVNETLSFIYQKSNEQEECERMKNIFNTWTHASGGNVCECFTSQTISVSECYF